MKKWQSKMLVAMMEYTFTYPDMVGGVKRVRLTDITT